MSPSLKATCETEDREGDLQPASGSALKHKAAVVEMIPQSRSAWGHGSASVLELPAHGVAALVHAPTTGASVLRDLAELFKVKVVLLVMVTGWGGYYLGSFASGVSSMQSGLLDALLGIGLVSAGAGALNEALERRTDALMKRTANRPLAAGRMNALQGFFLGFGAVLLGALWLHLFANPLTEVLALATAFMYAAIYTPLKRVTPWATFIGAFPGAMGPLLGWTAARGRIEAPALALFAILFVWQFPHFMSIAWLYRNDYARAGIRMLPAVQPKGVSTVVVALVFAVLMIPVSLAPILLGMAGPLYCVLATALGLLYLASTVRFARILRPIGEEASRAAARSLLKVSVLYLPLLFTTLMLCASRAH
ncbi:heme o synthase [Telmatobacter bradus]|uniref:heme o synthase n=1 Tax=Telmatobacter bradus TaxID=474953 RepID=UPI003B42BFF2